jgi:hypothetical protein
MSMGRPVVLVTAAALLLCVAAFTLASRPSRLFDQPVFAASLQA